MKIVSTKTIQSSFMSCEKDLDKIIHLLLVDNKPYSDQLKRLLLIEAPDCLNPNKYIQDINKYSDADMIKKGYIRKRPRVTVDDVAKNYIIINFTDFYPNAKNPAYRDSKINIDILCQSDYWDLNDMSSRPVKIMGYIDGILNNSKLSGIGQIYFESANILVLNEQLMGYSLVYNAIHNNLPSDGDDTSIEIVQD